ncbi:Ger(x)C family spore germination protein [Paenibacillus alkalitolerans]|uniref:Ger(x)C family spore germination protein n=1 Tax=Paenibacillus alkalitolerans TaxID=2799335 RepID=UPI0018F6544B|nr:Ger(x)C family spore germination protein [Paenibacillus alkalitolerans]
MSLLQILRSLRCARRPLHGQPPVAYFRRLNVVLVALIIAATGCGDIKDINHRALPLVMAIAPGDEKDFRVALQIPLPGRQQYTVRTVSAEGDTVSEAIQQVQMNVENHLDLLHLKLVIFHIDLIKKGINEELEYVIRSRQIAPKSFIAVTESDIVKLLKSTRERVEQDGTTFYNFFSETAGWTPNISNTRLWEAYRAIHSSSQDYMVAIVRIGDDEMLESRGSATIAGGKMVDRLDSGETLLVNIFNNKFQGAVIQVLEKASVQVTNAEVQNRVFIERGVPKLRSKLTLYISIEETKGKPSPGEIRQQLDEEMERRFRKMLKRTQKHKADLFHIGQHFRRILTLEEMKKWRSEYYPRLEADIEVETLIRNTGDLINE